MSRILLFLAFVSLISCKAQKEVNKPVGENIQGMVLVDYNNFSGILKDSTMIIRDNKSLRKFYSEINKTRKPGLPVPIIDFSKDMAIVICLGEQQSERSVSLSKVKESETDLTIAFALTDVPPKKETDKTLIYYPFYLYKLPLVDKSIHLQHID